MKQVFRIGFILLLSILPLIAFSQTITTKPLSDNTFCTGDGTDVYYDITGTFDVHNVFFVELSQPDGSFTNYRNIGNITSSTSGKISVIFPANLTPGINYRLRVCSSNNGNYIIGSDNGADITILLYKSVGFSIGREDIFNYYYYRPNEQIQFTLSDTTNYPGANWDFGEGANPSSYLGTKPPPVEYSTPGYKKVNYSINPNQKCFGYKNATSWLYSCACEEKIDSNAFVIDSTYKNFPFSWRDSMFTSPGVHAVWLMPNANVTNNQIEMQGRFYIETGGSLNLSYAWNCAFYLKPGASVYVHSFYRCIIFRAPGSSINVGTLPDDSAYKVIDCPYLKFDYKAAPQRGIELLMNLGFSDIQNETNINTLKISPNPVGDILNIENRELYGSRYNVQIFTPEGIKILETENRNQIDVRDLPSGVYFIKIGNYVNKFVKIR